MEDNCQPPATAPDPVPVHGQESQGGGQEPDRMDDMLDQVEELPLDEEGVELLPTVVEEPEREAKEQEALLEDGEPQEPGTEVQEQEAVLEEGEPQEPETEVQEQEAVLEMTADEEPEGAGESEATVVDGSQPDPAAEAPEEESTAAVNEAEVETANTTEPVEQPDVLVSGEYENGGQAVGQVTDTSATAESERQGNSEDPSRTARSLVASETGAADGGPVDEEAGQSVDRTKQAEDEAQIEGEKDEQQDERRAVEDTGVPVGVDDDSAERKSTDDPSPAVDEQADEAKKEKKKRKKKKSVEENTRPEEPETTKPSLTHVRGGFSCGWVGPMLQLLGAMKKMDEFKECHGKRYTPKGHEFGVPVDDTVSEITEDDPVMEPPDIPEAMFQAPPGEGCPRCGGAVFEAEKMKSRFRNYHKPCFNCKACHRILDSTKACDGPDRDVYCKLCYSKKYGPKGYGFGGGAAFLQSDVIAADSAQTKPEWVSLDRTSIKPSEGAGCPRCGGAVFAAELMMSKGQDWHVSCFSCHDCKRPLDSTIACDGPDKEIYCNLDYAKRFGPKGFGFGRALVSFNNTEDRDLAYTEQSASINMGTKAPPGEGCPRCGFPVYAAEMMLSKGQEWHIPCFSCHDCKRPLDSTIACDGPDKEIYCKLDYAKRFGPKGFGFGKTPTLVAFGGGEEETDLAFTEQSAPPSMGAKAPPGEGCPKCGFSVFAAEMMLHEGLPYHKHCYCCGECHRSLDSTNTCSGPDGQLLCRTCYGRQHGPKGVGYGQGAGVLSMG